ncbi:MAG: DNA-directed RNA polymerase subunit omega [Candidatus Marinamargulisbacteria bacterium]|jgi:DNA-directed RNA polymerase subunit K/omega|nr:DNA-directed RNA polymerase subunit omega [Candidatus Marinamargulisbacteria bacterium]
MNLSDAERKDLILTHLSREYPNHFLLTKAVAIRARELKSGSTPLLDGFTDDQARNQSVLVALEEFYEKKLVIQNDQPEPIIAEEKITKKAKPTTEPLDVETPA